MPLNVLFTFIIGAALGWLLVKLMRVPHHLQGLVLGCCAAGTKNHLHLLSIIYNFLFNNLKSCKLS
jgi:putative effector of murein hydrolase